MVINPRTPTDIPLTEEEEEILARSVRDAVSRGFPFVRWFLIREDESLEDESEQERLRPADARDNRVEGTQYRDWYMPWYATANHVHAEDRGPMAWGIHAYGTEAAVRVVHRMVLLRLGRL